MGLLWFTVVHTVNVNWLSRCLVGWKWFLNDEKQCSTRQQRSPMRCAINEQQQQTDARVGKCGIFQGNWDTPLDSLRNCRSAGVLLQQGAVTYSVASSPSFSPHMANSYSTTAANCAWVSKWNIAGKKNEPTLFYKTEIYWLRWVGIRYVMSYVYW